MEELDKKIETMFREQLYLIIAENGSRIKKITIRYTKENKKNSLEHLDALCVSYERALRNLSKDFLRTEKTVRLKYRVPISEGRRHDLLKQMHLEVEMLVNKMIREYRHFYATQHKGEEFDRKMEASLAASKKKVEEGIEKLVTTLEEEISVSGKIPPNELARIYSLDEWVLVDLKAIEPLQTIHQVFDHLSDDERARAAFDGIQQSIILCSKIGTRVQIDPTKSNTPEGRRFKKMSMVAGTLVLKELISDILIMVEQIRLPEDKRNEDIIQKSWIRLKNSIKGQEGSEKVLEHLTPFSRMFALSDKEG